MATFHSLLQMLDALRTEEECRVYLENMRWNGEPICPHCGSISAEHSHQRHRGILEHSQVPKFVWQSAILSANLCLSRILSVTL